MALRVAVANGNWSSTSTWYGGVLPAAGDVIASNGFTVTIDQNVNVDSITNTVQSPVSAVPIMTDYTVPSGIASASQEYTTPQYAAWKAFDGSVATNSNYWLTSNSAFIPPQWVQYEFLTSKVIRAYSVQGSFGAYPTGWQFQAWDGSAWITLDTVTGGGSLATPVIRTFTNNIAYTRYRFNMTAASNSSNFVSVGELKMFELIADTQTSVSGGGFLVDSTKTITFTNPNSNSISANTTTCLTYSGTSATTLTINTISGGVTGVNKTSGGTIEITGGGNLIFNGNLTGAMVWFAGNSRIRAINAGTITIVGDVLAGGSSGYGIQIVGSNTILNVTGNLYGGGDNDAYAIYAQGSTNNVTIVGNSYPSGSNRGGGMRMSCTGNLNFTGTIYGGYNASQPGYGILVEAAAVCNITGNFVVDGNISNPAFNCTAAAYINHIGTISTINNTNAYLSTNSGAINILTGPFISSPSGYSPIYVSRMHYRRTFGSYFEFRDNSTNGALPPAGSAPATRLVSPDTVVAAPIPANVRQGRVYALGSQVGTMIVPSPANVVKNVPVDNTVGTGVLDPSALWNVPLSAINTTGSIGQRVKNASTVESTGAQIQTTLNNNP